MKGPRKRLSITAICAALASLALAGSAQAAASDPLFVFVPTPPPPPATPTPPPTGYLEGPCGLGVDSTGNFYVSDYYHDAIDVFNPTPSYQGQLASQEPLDGPCQLALDSANHLYVNDFHRGVLAYGAFPSFGTGLPITGAFLGETHPTGVAVDPTTGYVYVDERTFVGVYEPSGAPVEEGGEPLRIGEGTLGNGYGLALSRYSATAGYLYVPDASTKTVKVYDPATDKTNPVAEIHAPASGFVSLRDSAVAVDWASGRVYVVDDLQPQLTEEPQAVVYAFGPTGLYLGVLKYKIYDALPPGLAVDNSSNATQGRVYVTSGNTDQAGVYAYGPGAQIGASLPPSVGLAVGASGTGEGTITSGLGRLDCSGSCEAQIRSGAEVTLTATPAPGSTFAGWSGEECEGDSSTCTVRMDGARSVGAAFAAEPVAAPSFSSSLGRASASSVSQQGNVRLSVTGSLSPKKLPRRGVAPISVTVGWQVASADGSPPPTLKRLGIEINRHGQFDYEGLAVCPLDKIQPASTQRALANCRSSLVGKGTFAAEVALRGQEAYEATGRLLMFNGQRKGKPVLYGQIYAAHPFATSFVIPFELKELRKGPYGTALEATLPKGLAAWGNLTGIQMTLNRRYHAEGESRSYVSAACPAPEGFSKAVFPLARTSFSFTGGAELGSVLSGDCRVRG